MTLTADLYCSTCDYNLRGLDPAGHCPECGDPIAPSLAADQRPRLRRLAIGAVVCLSNAILLLVSEGTKLFATTAWRTISQFRAYWYIHSFLPIALMLTALWAFTPAPLTRRVGPVLTWSTRLCILPWLAWAIAWHSVDFVDADRMWWFDHAAALAALFWPLLLGQWLAASAKSLHLRHVGAFIRIWQLGLPVLILAEVGTYYLARPVHRFFRVPVHTSGFFSQVCLLADTQDFFSALFFALLLLLILRELRRTPLPLRSSIAPSDATLRSSS